MLIDVSLPITSGSVYRLGTPPIRISSHRFYHESEGDYETVMLSLPAHAATHLDLVFPDKCFPLRRMIGPGTLIDATHVQRQEIGISDITNLREVKEGDFVLFRTDWTRFFGSAKYYQQPDLAPEVIDWLVSRRVNAVGIDALGLAGGGRHGEYDRLLTKNDIFVIENLVNLAAIPEGRCSVYCFPLRIDGIDAIPARVIVEIAE